MGRFAADCLPAASINARDSVIAMAVVPVTQPAVNHESYGKRYQSSPGSASHLLLLTSLPAIHPCTLPCHAPSACSEAEPCRAIINISCPCGRIVQPVPCGRSTTNPGGREGSQQLKCSNECALAKRNARLADALGISADRAESRSQVTYHESLITFARGDPNFCAMVEKSFAEYVFLYFPERPDLELFSSFVTSEKKSQILPHMPPTRRKFVHDVGFMNVRIYVLANISL